MRLTQRWGLSVLQVEQHVRCALRTIEHCALEAGRMKSGGAAWTPSTASPSAVAV